MKNPHKKIQEYLSTVTNKVSFKEARGSIQQELLTHIEEHLQTAQSYGLSYEDAVAESLRRMGDPTDVGTALDKAHQPKTDFLTMSLVAILCSIGLYIVRASGWSSVQALWVILGTVLAAAVFWLPYRALIRVLAAFYLVAVLALAASQFSGIHLEGQPYLSLFGLRLKIVDLSSALMATGLAAIGELYYGQRKILLPVLTLVPITYFTDIGSAFPAALLLSAGIAVMSFSKTPWISTAVVGSLLIARLGTTPFLSKDQLGTALVNEGHTDFAISTLVVESRIGTLLVVTLFVFLLGHLVSQISLIKTQWLRATAVSCTTVLGVEIIFSLFSNFGLVSMFKTGANIPFLSYGGSLMVAHLLMVGTILACLRRRSWVHTEHLHRGK